MTPTEVASRYFANMRERNIDAQEALFAPDAVFILPDGRELVGQGQIRAMYEGLFAASPPIPTPTTFIADGKMVAVEIEAQLEDGGVRRTANFFFFNDVGLVERLNVYRRG